MVRRIIAPLARSLPGVGGHLRRLNRYERFCPLGHYYSPLVSAEDLGQAGAGVFDAAPEAVAGVDLRVDHQLAVLRELGEICREWPFPESRSDEYRYWSDNGYYRLLDGLTLFGMLRRSRPRRVVEVGSGFSSALMLDTRDRFLGDVGLTFIEPYPDRLLSLLREADRSSVTVVRAPVQRAPLSLFEELEAGDVLFIDSSHVGKLGSDVNFLFFEVLPRLRKGVLVHVHDVFWPFGYPRQWVEQGRHWNEAYYVRLLLMSGNAFAVELWCDYLRTKRPGELVAALPMVRGRLDDFEIGTGIWLSRAS